MQYTVFPTPLGLLGAASTSEGLCCIKIKTTETAFRNYLQANYKQTPEKSEALQKELVKQFGLYFSGKLRQFSLPLDLSQGTPFQKKIWRRLCSIPSGSTQSYEWLVINNPNSCRAAGNAVGKNPLPIVVPCHRIVRKNGELGGYSGGLHIKKFLLSLENSSYGTV